MKRVLFLLLTMVAVMASAENAVAIYQKDGTVVCYAFDEKPVATYVGRDLVLTTTKTAVQYPLSTLRKMCFEYDGTAVAPLDAPAVQFQITADAIIITGEQPGTTVTLFDQKGVKQAQCTVSPEGTAHLSTAHLSPAIYIVKTASTAFKVRKS